MSWTRQNFENELYIISNFTSGYWANDANEEFYGPFEDEIINDRGIDTSKGYYFPRMKYFETYHDQVAPGDSYWLKHHRSLFVVGLPDVNTVGYFYASAVDNPYKAMFKVGEQSGLFLYNKSDDTYAGRRYLPDVDGVDSEANRSITTGGMVSEMEEMVDFYKNGYENSQFVILRHITSDTGMRDEDGQIFQVPYEAWCGSVGFNEKVIRELRSIYLIDPADTFSSTSVHSVKTLPHYLLRDNSSVSEGVPELFYTDFYTYPTSYLNYREDLRSRYKYQELIDTQNQEYVDNKVAILADMIDTVLEMPKEFRVRMQSSEPYNLTKVSSISGMEGDETPTSTSSPSSMGAMTTPTGGGYGSGY